MKTRELFFYMKQATEDGASKALLATAAAPTSINKTQAYRLYGRCNIDRWILEGILRPISIQTSQILFDPAELESISDSNNRITYLQVAER
ncbi:hypothetical protein [Sphingobacterium siyangense]|uniref:Uncharacterized protein n=1 Tax=Sphingobacterium siyangense TaxID=459529 RepID=A0A562M789_9SPHI|nr:hypothetical protein [Sphingobacterium siyangense]TWI15668.1 hypothetical protein IQ31_04951 [Sphingobacterium siyangense]